MAQAVLVIAAHMDDEVLGPGATIARHVEAGDSVAVCIVCQRAYDHKFEPAEVEAEKHAARRAAAVLGYSDLRFLNLRDELLDERLLDILVPLEACIADVRPSLVYTHHRGDSNQDHRAVLQASLIGCRSISRHKVPRVMSYEVPSSTDVAAPFPELAFQPNYYVNVERFLDRKLEAIQAYERELREFPHPRSVKGLEVLAQKRGMEVGFLAAEAFVVIRDEWA
ncbi:MAG TPA: PIG-L deacetylase family protein [Chloroflexota bacterium]|nr:PIG-L deacetylase family protein [Chloroflexota bacterium]